MPHQCLKCGQVFEEGSSELLRDCPDCGGNRFFFTKEPLNEEERNSIIREVGKDINSVSIDLIGGDGDIVDKSGSRVTIKPKEIRKVVEQHLLEKKRTESEKKEKRVIREIDRFIKQRERPDAQRKKIEKRKEDREKKKMRRLELKKAKQDGVEEKRELRVKARMDAKKKRVKAKKTLKAREQLEEKALEKEKKPALKHSKKQIIEKKTGKLSLFGRIKIGKAPAKPEKIKHRLLSRKEKPGETAVKEEEKELHRVEKGEIKEQEFIEHTPKEVTPSVKPEKKAVEEPIEFKQHEKQKKDGISKGSRKKGERRRPESQTKRDLKQKESERKKAEFGGMEPKKVEIEKTDAVIKDVKIYTDTHYFVKNFDNCYEMKDLWAKRPKLYGNTNILFVTTKSSEGKEISEIFPVFLRFDGTLEPNAANRISRMHRNRFASFLKYYKITEKIEDYNIVERMNEWEGKEVKMISHKGRNQIFTPYHWVGDKHRDK